MSTIERVKTWPWVSTFAAASGAGVMVPRFVDSLSQVPAYNAVMGPVALTAPVLSVGAGITGVLGAVDKQRSGLSRIFSGVAGVVGLSPVVTVPVLMGAPEGIGLGIAIITSALTMAVSGTLNVVAHTIDAGKKPARPASKAWWVGPAIVSAALGYAVYFDSKTSEAITLEVSQHVMSRAASSHRTEAVVMTFGDDKVAINEPGVETVFDFTPKGEVCAVYRQDDKVTSHHCGAMSKYSEWDRSALLGDACHAANEQGAQAFVSRHCAGPKPQ